MHTVYISIGSNLGNRKQNIRKALEKLSSSGIIKKCSRPYRTLPYGPVKQPDFINMAVQFETALQPQALLIKLQEIEKELGRVKTVRWGERTIDLDIIFFDEAVIEEKTLIIPHPDMHRRLFVLRPLMDICPDFIHPVLKKDIRTLYRVLKQ